MGHFKTIVEENIRLEILAIIWVLYLWTLYLSLRQRKLMQSLEVPPKSLDGLMPLDVYQKARNYSLDKNIFGEISNLFSTILNTVFIHFFAFHYFWQWGSSIVDYYGISKDNEILISAACMFVMNLVTMVTGLPFKIYSVFVLEQKYGFNKQSPGFFAKDQVKKFIVMQVVTFPILCGIIWIVKNSGDNFFIYVWLFSVVISLFMIVLYPEVIAPLFDKYSPLSEGELKTAIEALAASVGFPLYKLYIVEGSKRSSHSNAYMYGFYKNKRIVLYDTLVKGYCKSKDGDSKEDMGCEVDEVVGILAHELGHWKYSHTIKLFLLTQISFCLNLLPFSLLLDYKPMYVAFGFMDSQPVFIGLIIVMMYILTPVNALMGFLMTMISRRFEFQADQFGKQLGHAEPLKRALVKLHTDNLAYPLFDTLYSSWHHDHPPLLERLGALDKTE
ncbi:CAAX prenyl protease 1 homolog [Venturia canescens]|uniref:CAAX prenyl protease 1 homolog n=1 Tax=Venturia canescens TaxID=32260 RepID=UPI001C9CF4F1|nr:CAAX prenyl protease 1 homolog [Venturia canescens]